MHRDKFIAAMSQYVPSNSIELIADWVFKNPVKINITAARKTKLGDFKATLDNKINTVSVNGNLNCYSFLITLLHEFAHSEVFTTYGRTAAHGKLWKTTYQKIMNPFIINNIFPEPLKTVIINHMKNPKASSHADLKLVRELNKFDIENDIKNIFLETLPKNSIFELNGKKFIKGEKRRTRFMCYNLKKTRKYTVSALAEVILINDNLNTF